MYAWFWRQLPGGTLTRMYTAVVCALVVAVLLWYVAFPWLEPKIHFDHGTVGDGNSSAPGHPGHDTKHR